MKPKKPPPVPADEYSARAAALQQEAELLKRATALVAEKGMFPIHAWQAVGGNRRTYERYLQKARFGIEPYVSIVEQMDQAAAKWLMKIVPTAWGSLLGKKDGKGLFDALGRLCKDWSQKQSIQVVRDPELELLWSEMMEEFGAEATERFATRYERALAGRPQATVDAGAAEGR